MKQLLSDIVTGKVKHPLYEKLFEKFPKGSGQNASLEELGKLRDAVFETLEAIEKENNIKNTIVVQINNGNIQFISSTIPIQVIVLEDTDKSKDKLSGATIVKASLPTVDYNPEYCNIISNQVVVFEEEKLERKLP